ncbi:UvrD-helicase domain-containing protein [Patescibacteria group bacterium]|nr:UvrD-helicase domain-containing protein [Patescibacteria group bacterium]
MTKVYKLKQLNDKKKTEVNYSAELNEEQYKVVSGAEGPCLVLAGAGSGKTRTICYRVAYLLEHGIRPQNILLLTFTNKASKEMLSRVEELLKSHPGGLWGGTFHHVANRVLRKYAKKINYESNFNILDSSDSKDLLKACIKDLGLDPKQRRIPSPNVIKDIISYHINSQKSLKDVISMRQPQWLDWLGKIEDIHQLYIKRKQRNNLMDFDDLLFFLLKLLENNPNIKKSLATQFQYILVDEYQDTNYLQASIVKHLASVHNNILVVGDDAQSIYAFRAADIGNILNFPRLFPSAQTFKLETNYRSTPDILEVANDIISNNVKQFPKDLKSVLDRHVKPQLIPCTTPKQEAEFIASMILQMRDEGLLLDKMAVLFRATHHSQTLEMELNKRDIPYDYRGGLRFFERAHIKDIVAFLKILNNIKDEISWLRILNMQIGIGSITADNIVNMIRESGVKEVKKVLDLNIASSLGIKASLGWDNLSKVLQAVISVEDKDKTSDIIRAIIKSDYRDYLISQHTDAAQRLDDLEQLAMYADSYDDLNKFVDEVTLQEGFGVKKGQVDPGDEKKLILTTVHQAKGLEWESVFIMNMVESGFPNQRALTEAGGLEEERRLFYVAATRAQKQLYLTYPLIGGFDSSFNQMSQLILELDQKKLERGSIENVYDGDDMVIQVDEDGNRGSILPEIDDL